MRHRALLAAASVALLGALVVGEMLELPTPRTTPTPLPYRLGCIWDPGTYDLDAVGLPGQQASTKARRWT
jgi:hypothetical protein